MTNHSKEGNGWSISKVFMRGWDMAVGEERE
jgi:hypothetical protein